MKGVGWTSVLVLAVLAAATLPAQAYVDPGMGSLVLQGLLGGIAVGLVFLRQFWTRIKTGLRRFMGVFVRTK